MSGLTGIQEVVGSIIGPASYLLQTFGHGIVSTAIFSLPLIRVGQLSVSAQSLGT